MYGELAEWYPLVTGPEDYDEEAGLYFGLLARATGRMPGSLLELGAGAGHIASHYKRQIDAVTLSDLSDTMLDLSRGLNPDCEHVQGDMRTLQLGREFDAVFIHDAIGYLTTLDDLRAALTTAFVHCRPGGLALITPDTVRETFRDNTDHGGRDAPDGRALRYLQWMFDPDPTDSTYCVEYTYVLHAPGAAPRAIVDRHEQGLFSTTEWLATLAEVGFQAEVHRLTHSEEPQPLSAFIGRRPPTIQGPGGPAGAASPPLEA
ncbi:MAG: hypothetical protein NVSMB2_27390 [Chloroflexota bacterium]